jgi:hypothetical protein
VFHLLSEIDFSGVCHIHFGEYRSDSNVWSMELARKSAIQLKGYAEDLKKVTK